MNLKFSQNPNWGYMANIIQVGYFGHDIFLLATSKITINDFFYKVDWLNLIWMFIISLCLVQLLKLIKQAKTDLEKMKEESQLIQKENTEQFEMFKKKMDLSYRLSNLKCSYGSLQSTLDIGNNKKAPGYFVGLFDSFQEEELLYMVKENIFSEKEKRMMITVGMLRNFDIK